LLPPLLPLQLLLLPLFCYCCCSGLVLLLELGHLLPTLAVA
jgi:hypothetical protein